MSPLRVAMIGHGFMGAAHSQGWRVAPHFFDLPARVEMACLVGRSLGSARAAANRWGWHNSSDDWRTVVADPSIDIVDIVTPSDSHAEIAVAALNAGKHVLCEKPLANTVAEAEEMAVAAIQATTISMVGFTYRRVPAIGLAKRLVDQGMVGDIQHVTASYLQDWLIDPEVPLTWRLDKERAGSGALGDLGTHAIDLAQYVTGSFLSAVSGTLQTIVTERPLLGEKVGLSGTTRTERGEVTVDDRALIVGRFDSGALATFEATRFSTGRKNALRLEVSGSRGAVAFDLEAMNTLQVFDATAPNDRQGFTSVIATEPSHPYVSAWWPAGHMLGYEHAFSHQVADFVTAISEGIPISPTFAEGLQVQRTLQAVETSAQSGSVWTTVE
ncbi:MAG: Gfo/Idh/MocA family oxidoreductase [Terrimesophilobacter sp.]